MPLLLGENAVTREQVEETSAAVKGGGGPPPELLSTSEMLSSLQSDGSCRKSRFRTGTGGAGDLIGIFRV